MEEPAHWVRFLGFYHGISGDSSHGGSIFFSGFGMKWWFYREKSRWIGVSPEGLTWGWWITTGFSQIHPDVFYFRHGWNGSYHFIAMVSASCRYGCLPESCIYIYISMQYRYGYSCCLVVWNIFIFHILGISSSQLTNSIIFQRGRSTTNQIVILYIWVIRDSRDAHPSAIWIAKRMDESHWTRRWIPWWLAFFFGWRLRTIHRW